MDENDAKRLRALRDALTFLKNEPVPSPSSVAQRVAAGALVRGQGLIQSILLLVQSPDVSITEVDVLVRVLLELAITTAWIGEDEERAARYRDDGVRRALYWRRVMEAHGVQLHAATASAFDCYAAEFENRDPLPTIEQMATKTAPGAEPRQGWVSLKREYDFIYRRLSAAVHHDHRLQALVVPLLGERAISATLSAAVLAAGVLVSSASEPLGMVRGIGVGLNLALQ